MNNDSISVSGISIPMIIKITINNNFKSNENLNLAELLPLFRPNKKNPEMHMSSHVVFCVPLDHLKNDLSLYRPRKSNDIFPHYITNGYRPLWVVYNRWKNGYAIKL